MGLGARPAFSSGIAQGIFENEGSSDVLTYEVLRKRMTAESKLDSRALGCRQSGGLLHVLLKQVDKSDLVSIDTRNLSR